MNVNIPNNVFRFCFNELPKRFMKEFELRFNKKVFMIFIVSVFIVLQGFYVAADQLLTKKRDYFKGDLILADGRILLKNASVTNEYRLNDLLDIIIENPVSTPASAMLIFPSGDSRTAGGLPKEWKNQDVGYSRNKGSAAWQPDGNDPSGVFTLRSSGAGFTNVSDSFHYAWVKATGAGVATVRVSGRSSLDKSGRAGLILRQSVDTRSTFAAVGINRDGLPVAETRYKDGAPAVSKVLTNQGEYTWLKLWWSGTKIIVGFSSDGVVWENAELPDVNLTYPAYIGLFVYSGNERYAAQSRFSSACIVTFDKTSEPQPITTGNSIIFLKNGSMIAGTLEKISDNTIAVKFSGENLHFSINDVNSIQFLQVPQEWQNEGRIGPGIFLINGRFAEARNFEFSDSLLTAFIEGKKRIFRAGCDIAGVQFSQPKYQTVSYEIRLTNGSIVCADSIRLMENGIAIQERTFGELKIEKDALARIRRVGNLEGGISGEVNVFNSRRTTAFLETVKGEKFTGTLQIDGNELCIQTHDKIIKLTPGMVKKLSVDTGTGSFLETAKLSEKIRRFSSVDLCWKSARGRNYVDENVLYLEDGAAEKKFLNPEPTYFVYYPIDGDFEISSEIIPSDALPGGTYAGLLAQDSLESKANGVFCGTDLKSVIVLRRHNDRPDSIIKTDSRFPLKIKIERTRRRLNVNVLSSKDGNAWTSITSYERDLPTTLYVGFALINTNKNIKTVLAGFKNIEMQKKQATNYPARIVLIDGSLLNCEVINCNENGFTVSTTINPRLFLPMSQVGILCFDGEIERTDLEINRRGIMFKNNDFLECEIKSIEGTTVKVSSTLFGIRYFNTGDPVKRIFINKVTIKNSGYMAVLKDNSKIFAEKLNIQGGKIILNDGLTTTLFECPVDYIVEIKKL